MATSEARRRDLDDGLDELLGTERADTLMAYERRDRFFLTQSADLIAIVGNLVAALLL